MRASQEFEYEVKDLLLPSDVCEKANAAVMSYGLFDHANAIDRKADSTRRVDRRPAGWSSGRQAGAFAAYYGFLQVANHRTLKAPYKEAMNDTRCEACVSSEAPPERYACATVGASPATVVRRMSRGWLSS